MAVVMDAVDMGVFMWVLWLFRDTDGCNFSHPVASKGVFNDTILKKLEV